MIIMKIQGINKYDSNENPRNKEIIKILFLLPNFNNYNNENSKD